MDSHPEERRIAGLLRELIARSGTTPAVLEKRLGWKPGRLTALLDGRERLSFGDVLAMLPLLGTTPTEFFARLYSIPSEEPRPSKVDQRAKQRAMDRLFERSLRAVRNAIARRADWKRKGAGKT